MPFLAVYNHSVTSHGSDLTTIGLVCATKWGYPCHLLLCRHVRPVFCRPQCTDVHRGRVAAQDRLRHCGWVMRTCERTWRVPPGPAAMAVSTRHGEDRGARPQTCPWHGSRVGNRAVCRALQGRPEPVRLWRWSICASSTASGVAAPVAPGPGGPVESFCQRAASHPLAHVLPQGACLPPPGSPLAMSRRCSLARPLRSLCQSAAAENRAPSCNVLRCATFRQ